MLELLNIKNYIIINNLQKIINKETTYCVGTHMNMTNEIIDNYYYTISVETLKKQTIIKNVHPKKTDNY